jgi:hypothetical protein
MSPVLAVRPEGADHKWRKIPPRELSIDLVADERLVRATARAGASQFDKYFSDDVEANVSLLKAANIVAQQ